MASGDEAALRSVRRICAPDALLEIVIGLDPSRDQSEINRLGLKSFSVEFIDAELIGRYRSAGFEIKERGSLAAGDWPEFKTSWAKRLKGNDARPIIYLIARAA
ncbi:MAG TPA: hypothetical protein VLA93_14595 [Pyrinomonadaceae bacterium]|nr:hypothetical protein [Pyrinomonadaceae bacterium]